MVYGPYLPGYPPPKSRFSLGTNEYVYHLIRGGPDGSKTYPRMGVTHIVSVQDTARAHVLAIQALPLPEGKRKRLIVSSGSFTWPEGAEYLKTVRPALTTDLEKTEPGPKTVTCSKLDMKLMDEVIGMRPDNMMGWKECLLETVDALLQWETVAS